MHSPVFSAQGQGGEQLGRAQQAADQQLVDTATQFVDQLLLQAQQEVNNKQMAAGAPQPAQVEPGSPEDEDITTIDGLLKRGTRWQSRARQGARGLVTRLLTTLRLCK